MRRSLTVLGVAILAFGLATPAWAPPPVVPEIDPSLFQGGLTLLVGGVLVLLGCGRRK